MNYIILYFKDRKIIAVDDTWFEHPPEDFLRDQVSQLHADFADVSRAEL